MRLLFLHGPPAAGKLTTARALSSRVGYPVFHNHLVVDTLTTVFPFGSEPFIRLREQFWLQVFTEAARSGRSLVFTFAPEATVGAGFPTRAREVVEDQGGTVHFVRLAVGTTEQERRIGHPDRAEFHKLQDLETLRRLRGSDAPVEQPPVDLEIETDHSSPEQSASTIIERFALPLQAAAPRYPEG
ncbi:shikimate kinase [Brachybacterium sp. YJGR34]|uniref:shikimate kinase n=1 Tax=Brachybacterium sp. YJGR34 TaxID=2059911 RepID=UPI000E0B2BB5|nr:shikimate kinase [Brachybacterium sp. YJGR34]